MMERIRRPRPSYAGVTATLALVLALGTGGAYAANKIGSKQIAPSAVKSKHIKDGQVKPPDLANGAVTAPKLAEGVEGLQGPQGVQGPAGTARAYALIDSTGTVDATYGKGAWSVRRPGAQATGVYCLTPPAGIDPTKDPAIVTVEWDSSSGFDLLAYWNKDNTSNCTASEYEIRTYDFEREPTVSQLTNDVSFLIAIP